MRLSEVNHVGSVKQCQATNDLLTTPQKDHLFWTAVGPGGLKVWKVKPRIKGLFIYCIYLQFSVHLPLPPLELIIVFPSISLVFYEPITDFSQVLGQQCKMLLIQFSTNQVYQIISNSPTCPYPHMETFLLRFSKLMHSALVAFQTQCTLVLGFIFHILLGLIFSSLLSYIPILLCLGN